jgi:hypothetical protein
MTGTQWPPGYRLHAVSEDFLENPNVAFYEARGEAGHLEMLARRGVLKVMAAHDSKPTAPSTIPSTPTPTPERIETMTTETHVTRPLRSLPSRLDAAACLQVLARITDATTTDLAAAAETVTIEKVDAGLATTSWSIEDRMKFKHALSQHGIISRGRKTSISRL